MRQQISISGNSKDYSVSQQNEQITIRYRGKIVLQAKGQSVAINGDVAVIDGRQYSLKQD